MESFITIHKLPKEAGRITETYNVRSRKGGLLLGQIKWYGPWRAFTFYPEGNTVFDFKCLGELQTILAAKNTEHRIQLKAKKNANI